MLALTAYQTEFLRELVAARIDFVLVGGRAMQAHGMGRATRDLDVWISRSGGNTERVHPLIAERVEVASPALSVDALRLAKKRICLPGPENKEVDVLTSIGTLDFELAAATALNVDYGGARFRVLGLSELIYSKVVSASCNELPNAKARDLADLELLLELWRKRHRHKLAPNPDAQQAGVARQLRAGLTRR